MGGMGSGRRYQGGKDTTNDYRTLDVRRLQRDGFLAAGQSFGWSWMRNGKNEASINTDRSRPGNPGYRHQRGGSNDWTDQSYPVLLAVDTLHLWRAASVVPLPGKRMRAARGAAVYRGYGHFRLPTLLSAGLLQPAGKHR